MLRTKRKGFSLAELIVVMFLTSVVLLAITGLFASMFKTYRVTRTLQRDVENAQFALNAVTKMLRTSTIMLPDGHGGGDEAEDAGEETTIYAYDYSSARCLLLRFVVGEKKFYIASADAADPDDPDARKNCDFAGLSSSSELKLLTTGDVTGGFSYIPSLDATKSGGPRVGRVTVSMTVETLPGHPVHLQTSVSLHDYSYVGIGG